MKIFLRIFLLSIFCVLILNAESSVGKMFPDQAAGQANWIDEATNILGDTITDLMQKIFNNVKNLLHNKAVYTIFGLAAMLWLLNQLKNGYPTRDEMWKFAKWIILAAFILGVFSSYDVFTALIEYFTIPASWVVSSLNGVFSSNGNTMSEQVISLFNDIARICEVSFKKSFDAFDTWGIPDEFEKIFLACNMLPTWIMAICGFILGIALIAIIIFSKFMATLLLCFAPILTPFLAISFLKSYFYSWLKLWITYTLIAPIAMLVLSISTQTITKIAKYSDDKLADIVLQQQQWANYITPIITSIICLYILKKIPTWIQQIIGIQGVESSGLGMGAATVGTLGGATGAGIISKIAGQGFGSGFAKALPGGTTAGTLAGGATRALGSLGGSTGAGMQSLGNMMQSVNAGNGIMASAGKTLGNLGGVTRDISREMRRTGQSTINNFTDLAKEK